MSHDPIARVITAITDSNRRYMSSHLVQVIRDESLTEEEKVERVREMLDDAQSMTRNQLWQTYRDESRSVPPIQIKVYRNGSDKYTLEGKADERQLAVLRARMGMHIEIVQETTSCSGKSHTSTTDGGRS